jgi:hypothetical protein
MTRHSISLVVALLGATTFATAWQRDNVNSTSWSGVIINSGCTADEAFAELDKCFEKPGPGAILSLYDDTIRQVYELDAHQAGRYFGESVTVQGTLHGNAIQVAEIRRLTSIGLEVGQKAPVFSLRDQFDHEQDLESLRGPKGTILLFFRSADW